MSHAPPRSELAPRFARVTAVAAETHDTVTLTLEGRLAFSPGQFNMLYAFGVGEVPISISGDPARERGIVHTLRRVGPVTEALGSLAAGAFVGWRGPYGTAWPVGAARGEHLLVVAGGIGLAPLRPVLYRALAERERFGRVTLLYGARSPGELLFRSELEAWQRAGALECQVTVDRGDPGYEGPTGVVTKLIDQLDFDPTATVAMVCGPEVMLRFSARSLDRHGLPRERLYASAERNMKCATGFCGHCQLGPLMLCKHGPVLRGDTALPLLAIPEL